MRPNLQYSKEKDFFESVFRGHNLSREIGICRVIANDLPISVEHLSCGDTMRLCWFPARSGVVPQATYQQRLNMFWILISRIDNHFQRTIFNHSLIYVLMMSGSRITSIPLVFGVRIAVGKRWST